MQLGNLILLIPAIYLIVAAVIVLLLGVVAAKRPGKGIDHHAPTQYLAPALMVPALVLAAGIIYWSMHMSDVGMFVVNGHAQLTMDPFAAVLSFIAFAGTLIVMLLSLDHFGEDQLHKAEYYSLLMFAAVAASLVTAASDLIAIYLSLEFLSMISYVLAAFAKTDRRSGEAGLKYFLYGATCSAIMLYGMSILFGVTGGNTSLEGIARAFTTKSPFGFGAAATGAGFVGIAFTLVGFGFKLALVPFHFWAPDTYEGAPTPVTAFLSVVSKAAGIAVIIRFITTVALPAEAGTLSWYWILLALAVASMFYGNLVAIPQKNIKRMLAYSSIAQVGYMMVGVLADMHAFSSDPRPGEGAPWGIQGVLIYVIAYLLMNLGAFSIVVSVGKRLGSNDIQSYAGLIKRSPLYACALAVFLLSLAGIPPTAGFLGKFIVFGSAVRVGMEGHPELLILAALGVINSIISVYYYFNVVRLMFFSTSEAKNDVRGSLGVNTAIIFCLVFTLALIAFAKPVLEITSKAAYSSMPVQMHILR